MGAKYHYKKNGLLRRSKTAAKGPFDLLRRAVPSVLQCRYRLIAAVAKSAATYIPFSGEWRFIAAGIKPPPYMFRIRGIDFYISLDKN